MTILRSDAIRHVMVECPSRSSMTCCWLATLLLPLIGLCVWKANGNRGGAEALISRPEAFESRNAHIDNAKFLLMTLVVWQHAPAFANVIYGCPSPGSGMALSLWFHMPAFTILSGMVWKPFTYDRTQRFIIHTLVPLAIFATLFSAIVAIGCQFIGIENNFKEQNVLLYPIRAGVLGSGPVHFWYLRCLILWRVAAHVLQHLPVVLQLLIGIVGGATAATYGGMPGWQQGMRDPWDLGPFAVTRAAQMFPFFLLGQHAKQALLWTWPLQGAMAIAAGWMGFVALLIAFEMGTLLPGQSSPHNLIQIIISKVGQVETFPEPYTGMAWMAGDCPVDLYLLWSRYIVGISFRLLEAAAFLNLCVPRNITWFTASGSRSVYAYLLHPILVIPVVLVTLQKDSDYWANFRLAPSMPALGLAAWFLCSLLIAWCLASNMATRCLWWLVEPRWFEHCLMRMSKRSRQHL